MFFEQWNATPNFQQMAEYWCYRLEPITDLVATGRAKHVAIFKTPCDEDVIMKHPHCGSGVYMIIFKLRNEAGQMNFKAKLDRVDIENPTYPPCIPTGAWVDDRRNARWEWAKVIYDQRAADAKRTKENERAGGNPLELLQAVETMLDRRDARMRESMRTDEPKESVLDAVRIGLEMAKQPQQDKGADRSFDLMMAQLNALREENKEMTKRWLDLLTSQATAPAPAPKSTTEQLEDTARLIDAVEKIRPRRGTTQEQHPVLDLLERLVVPIVEQAAPIIGIAIQRGMQAQPKPAQRATPPAPGQPPAPTTAVQTQQPQPTTNANGETMYPIPKVIQEHFLTAFERMQPPFEWDGEMFANWLNAGYPTALGALRQVGSDWNPPMAPVDAILRLAKQTTVIWSMIEPVQGMEARLRQFLAECITFDQEHFDARSEPETETEEAPQ
jgi:hypothetical protein